MGRHGDSEVIARSDEELVALARIDLDAMLGGARRSGGQPGEPVGRGPAAVRRRPSARVDRISHGLRELPTVALCGAAFEGVGIAACVSTSYEAAGRVARGLELKAGQGHG